MDIYPFKICGSGYDIISEKSGYDPFLLKVYQYSQLTNKFAICNKELFIALKVHLQQQVFVLA